MRVPVPLKGIWTLAAPWRTTKNPVRGPLVVGLKVTFIVQLWFGVRLIPQDGCSPKSLQFAPWMVKPKGFTKLAATVPILLTVTVWGLLVVPTTTSAKLSEGGERVRMMLPVPLPVPPSDSFCGLPGALLVMITSPDLVAPEVGVKVTLIVHDAPGCKEPGQF